LRQRNHRRSENFFKFFIILKINLFFLTTSQMYLLHLIVGKIRNEVHVRGQPRNIFPREEKEEMEDTALELGEVNP